MYIYIYIHIYIYIYVSIHIYIGPKRGIGKDIQKKGKQDKTGQEKSKANDGFGSPYNTPDSRSLPGSVSSLYLHLCYFRPK